MSKRIFLWVGHPAETSLSASLADAYAEGADMAGAEIRRLDLSSMHFDSDGHTGYNANMPELEADLLAWQDNMLWADRVAFFFPYWWGSIPARAKSVFDRALTSGFAYKYHGKGTGWDRLLKGRSGDAFITSDTPPLIDRWMYGKPGRNVIKNQVFDFCGIKPGHIRQLGSVKLASDKKIQRWIDKTRELGQIVVLG